MYWIINTHNTAFPWNSLHLFFFSADRGGGGNKRHNKHKDELDTYFFFHVPIPMAILKIVA